MLMTTTSIMAIIILMVMTTSTMPTMMLLPLSLLVITLTFGTAAGLIHRAGRGWYSPLAQEFKLDTKPVAPLVRLLEKKFPLLEHTCWSTEQVRPYGHHLLARFVTFVHADRDALPSVAEFLKDARYDVHPNPRAQAARQFAIREKTVVLRPKHREQPHTGHRVTIEGLLASRVKHRSKMPEFPSDPLRV